MKLREENCVQREKLLQIFMDAITQSLNEESEAQPDTYFWSDESSTALLVTFKKLFESGLAIVDIKNPL